MRIKDFAGRLKFDGEFYNVLFDIEFDITNSKYGEYMLPSISSINVHNIRCFNDEADRMPTPENLTGEFLYYRFMNNIISSVSKEMQC